MSRTADDGSPVDLYARMPTFGEPDIVHAAIPAGAEVLELGAGAGRMTHRLVELGHPVTAVDSSAEMLAHVRGAETVHADIVGLDLGRRFACVLLASHLVNVDDDVERAGFLEACARHVTPEGVVLIQRYDPEWAADPQPSQSEREGVVVRVIEPRREGERLHATVEYEVDGATCRHGPFTSRILTDEELEERMGVAGLLHERWLDERRSWLAAAPAPDVSALFLEVPEAEPVVGAHRRRWDSAGVAVPAHVTILFPFLEPADLDDGVHAELRRLAAGVHPFDLAFRRVGRFPDVVWLAPEPAAAVAALTDAVVERWPSHQPYGGAFEHVVHHLTVADGAPAEVLDRVEADVSAALPITTSVREILLVCREGGVWRAGARIPLGDGGDGGSGGRAGTIGDDA
ncbi:MAG TPA: 2'-5' RNA ligase family protein [Candidatus Limnocylindrales bacterium]|nr:2'-5' RNA ligase family protein [Candidatus Limnocylindrales bacterium]